MKRGMRVIIFSLAMIFLIFPVRAFTECKNVYISNILTEKALDITFVADGFSNPATMEAQIKNLIQTMRKTPPFNEFIDTKINIRYTQEDPPRDLKCCNVENSEEASICNHIKVADLASSCPMTDEIIVFSPLGGNQEDGTCLNHSGVAAGGQHSVIYKMPNPLDKEKTEEISYTILHELGHSIAFLGDEYVEAERESILRNLDFMFVPNCEKNPVCEKRICTCPKWRNVPGAGCFQGCTYEDWYRDSYIDMMNNEYELPGPVDTLQLRSAMNRYIDYVKEPISLEINKKTEEFILQKLIEKNPEWKEGNIPTGKFRKDLLISNTNLGEFTNSLQNIFLSITEIPLDGIKVYTCHDYWLENKGDPKIRVKFDKWSVRHLNDYTIKAILYSDIELTGRASINANGEIHYILSPNGILKKRNCKDLVTINWDASMNNAAIDAYLTFSKGPLGTLKVEPKIIAIENILQKEKIDFNIEKSRNKLLELTSNGLDILNINHFTIAYNFATEINEETYSFEDELNNNLDEIGLSLKTSLDALGLEQLSNMGKPHGMILDFYLGDIYTNKFLTRGVEVAPLEETLRLSGFASLNSPLPSNKAECIKEYPLNFNSIDYNSFEGNISTDKTKFASIQLPQTFTNWFIATLWNDGFFCAEKEIPIGDNPPFIPGGDIVLTKMKYEIIPITPPYIDYTTIEDTNNDGRVDINHDLVSKGEARIEFTFNYKINEEEKTERIRVNVEYTTPLILEEPDLLIPQEKGFTFAQSFFKSDRQKSIIKPRLINCESQNIICDNIQSNFYEETFMQEIKENIASHIDRALYEIGLNPVRDVNLNFGEIGQNYFNPPINLNYGNYIAKITHRSIKDKWSIYDLDLVEKCSSQEDCGYPRKAKITSIQEIFQKEDISCIKIPTEESKLCIDNLRLQEGILHHYIKIKYAPSRPQDQVTYNFNLINWNAYKSPSQENIIYLADSISTYNLLLKTKEENANVHLLSVDATQIIVFRAKTQKGVEQNLKCMASIIIDKSPDMFNYHIQGIFITVKPRLRSDVNDDYVVCTIDSDSSLQQEILSSQK